MYRRMHDRRQILRGGLGLAGLGLLSGCGLNWPGMRGEARIPRIGFLAHPTIPDPWIDAFREDLRGRGHVEGQTFVIERRFTEGNEERLPELAAELIAIPVAVIVTRGAPPAVAAKPLTSSIPIVMVGVVDPVAQGLVNSLNRPGGNITGVINLPPELGTKCLELLKQSVPGISRVAVLFHPLNPGAAMRWRLVQEAAPRIGVTVRSVEVPDPKDIEVAFAASGAGADALLVLHDGVLLPHAARLAALASQARLPSVYEAATYVVDAGGLLSYEAEYPPPGGAYGRAAYQVDRILKGANPSELPVELPTHFRLTVNLKTARILGLTIPPSVLAQATEVIQ